MAFAGSQGGTKVGGMPVFAVAVAWIFLVQILAFIPAWLYRTEKFYDLTGSLTYVTTILGALFLSGHYGAPSIMITAAVVLWALRLGPFLFMRVRRAGADDRFDQIKKSFLRFLNVWMTQGLWVTITVSAALAAVTSLDQPGLNAFTIVGVIVWAAGLTLEVVADTQKTVFRRNPENKDRFISSGVWSWSRHPNYFGEITLWVGVAIMAFPALHGWQYTTLLSPVFVTLLLTKVSGVPLLERKAETKWGDQEEYRNYRDRTSVLVPMPPR